MNKILEKIKVLLSSSNSKAHGENGCVFISGAVTQTGNFYGFSSGSTLPDTIKITTSNETYIINGSILASTDDILDFVNIGEYVPIEFTSITITGTGFLKLWVK